MRRRPILLHNDGLANSRRRSGMGIDPAWRPCINLTPAAGVAVIGAEVNGLDGQIVGEVETGAVCIRVTCVRSSIETEAFVPHGDHVVGV